MFSFKSFLIESRWPPEIQELIDSLPQKISNPSQWKPLITKPLAKLGWNQIGRGSWGNTYSNDSKPYVIKIFSNDPYYKHWISVMKSLRNNPYIPKIYGSPFELPNGINVVRLEKLHSLTQKEWLNFMEIYHNNPDKELEVIKNYLNRLNQDNVDLSIDNIMRDNRGKIKITDPLAEAP